ncbi:hypothetical protein WJX81_004180 [Elliptochloris bilobata]|uniref:Uncharacterized protein n=1 Tax=Elliptochloris bilobata TaxID=381761 RepID=A0AAW1RZ36_9CHLO
MQGWQIAGKEVHAPLGNHHTSGGHRLQAPLTTLRGFDCSLAAPQSAPHKPPTVKFDLTGVWVKDTDASDAESYDRALDIMKLGRLQKITAARLIEGLEIRQSPYSLTVQFLTVVPFFKVTERFLFSRETTMQRRDLRGGEQRAQLRAAPDGLLASISWGEPYAGGVEETFTCPEAGVLHVTSTVSVGGQSETTLQVYRRSEAWKPKNKFTLGMFGLSAPPRDMWEGH